LSIELLRPLGTAGCARHHQSASRARRPVGDQARPADRLRRVHQHDGIVLGRIGRLEQERNVATTMRAPRPRRRDSSRWARTAGCTIALSGARGRVGGSGPKRRPVELAVRSDPGPNRSTIRWTGVGPLELAHDLVGVHRRRPTADHAATVDLPAATFPVRRRS
jgi:hypothetical protein